MSVYHLNKVNEALQRSGILAVDKEGSHWTYSYKSAKINLRVLPGCCGVMLIYNILGEPRHSLRLIKAACAAARKATFGVVLMSLRQDSELRKLLGQEWISIGFINPKTSNGVDILTQVLPTKPVKRSKVQYERVVPEGGFGYKSD